MISKKNLTSNTAIFGMLCLLVFLADIEFRQWQGQRVIEAQKQQLEQQADSLQKQNDELSQSLQDLNSTDYKESVAREQLDYKRQGEVVYGFIDSPAAATENPAASNSEPDAKKWLDYFFSD